MANSPHDEPPDRSSDSGSAPTLDDPGQSSPTIEEPRSSPRRSQSQSGSRSGTFAHSTESLFPDWERFQILDFLGAGGMGSVFKARDPRLQRLVAIKFLRVERLTGTELRQRQRFLREAQAQARLDHPHICKIHLR